MYVHYSALCTFSYFWLHVVKEKSLLYCYSLPSLPWARALWLLFQYDVFTRNISFKEILTNHWNVTHVDTWADWFPHSTADIYVQIRAWIRSQSFISDCGHRDLSHWLLHTKWLRPWGSFPRGAGPRGSRHRGERRRGSHQVSTRFSLFSRLLTGRIAACNVKAQT